MNGSSVFLQNRYQNSKDGAYLSKEWDLLQVSNPFISGFDHLFLLIDLGNIDSLSVSSIDQRWYESRIDRVDCVKEEGTIWSELLIVLFRKVFSDVNIIHNLLLDVLHREFI